MDERVFKILKERGVVRDGEVYLRTSLIISCPYRWLYSTEVTEAMIRGATAHEKWQEKLRQEGWLTEYEVVYPFSKGVYIMGHLDAYHPEKNVILEAKTSRNIYWLHTRQLEIYRWLIWKLTGKIPQGYLVYLDYEGNEKKRVRPFLASMDWVETFVKNRVHVIVKALVEDGDMPRVPDKVYCPYCQFKDDCPLYNQLKKKWGTR